MARTYTPGYCVVEQPGTLDFQARMLFQDYKSDAAKQFMQVNADTQWLKPGEIQAITDPSASVTTSMLNQFRQTKHKVNTSLVGVSTDEASFLQRNYGLIATITNAGDKLFSSVGDAGEKYFKEIERVLIKIESTYRNQFITKGSLISQEFFAERSTLFNQLKELVNKPLLKNLARRTLKLADYEDMRKALRLSSKSIVHEWSTVGLVGIPGYADYVDGAAKAAKLLKAGGYIGTAFAFANTTNDVIQACSVGREDECERVAFRDYAKFTVGTGVSSVGGYYGGIAGNSICLALGIITAPEGGSGALVCSAIGSLVGGYVAGKASDGLMDRFLQ
ncbi:membrane protein [Mangrovibacter sp. MFB070]|uniref:hypothetical protein n=1 Tax=Mangrovibacter sp. MFB070 TaxID=1224318 RepID=UPI0004D38C29|nr:hypothetical protein [Mangrovibacter sp. MFB070]KEA52910.1 membrane protein [Mangrovibacter sp. MFB070]